MAIIVIEEGNTGQGEGRTQTTLNLQYFVTPPGIVKLVQFVLGVILLFLNKSIFVAVVVYLAFTISNLWIFVYVFSLQQRWAVYPPWVVLEFYYTAGAAALYILSTLFGFILLYWVSSVFVLANAVTYCIGTYFLFQDWRVWKSNSTNESPMANVPK